VTHTGEKKKGPSEGGIPRKKWGKEWAKFEMTGETLVGRGNTESGEWAASDMFNGHGGGRLGQRERKGWGSRGARGGARKIGTSMMNLQ